jgi:4-amino-4-deoxy-L-arabinose transferase-like glycosyltransferase
VPERSANPKLLLAVLLLALLLRIPGVFWDLPGAEHTYAYHPDEPSLITSAALLHPLAGQWNPTFYNYGTLQIYLMYIPIALSRQDGGAIDLGRATATGRTLTLLFALGTVLICWLAGRRLAGGRGALVASLVIALAPLHVQHSTFVTVDVPAAFWIAAALYATIAGRHALGGLASGLAAATKYSAGLVLLVPVASLLGMKERRSAPRAILAVLLLAAAGFLLGCPGAVLWFRDFAAGIGYELNQASDEGLPFFAGTGPGWLFHLLHSLLPGLGWPLLLLVLASLVAAGIRGRREERVLLIYVVVSFILISLSLKRFARYTLPLYPAFALLVGWAARTYRGRIASVLLVAGLALTAGYATLLQSSRLRMDPRTEAARWIRTHVPRGSSIALASVPWFYSPPLDPKFGSTNPEESIAAARNMTDYRILLQRKDWDPGVLTGGPGYVLITSYETQDAERLGRRSYLEFQRRLQSGYEVAASFGGDPPVRAFSLVKALPHDMEYVSPEVTLYERR